MRENRTYGSEGGKRHLFPTPIKRLERAPTSGWRGLPQAVGEGSCREVAAYTIFEPVLPQ